MALLGAKDFDVSSVDTESLHFHHAVPLTTTVRDVNGDGIPDLVIDLAMSDIRLPLQAQKVRLGGWLRNSQTFIGEDKIRVVSNLANEDASCR